MIWHVEIFLSQGAMMSLHVVVAFGIVFGVQFVFERPEARDLSDVKV